MATNPTPPAEAEVEPLSEAALAQLKPLFDLIPYSPDDDGTGMLLRMLDAEDWTDLNVTSDLPSLKDLAPCRLEIHTILKRDSEMNGRMPIYLICEGKDMDTKKDVVFNTGAGQPFVALAMLNKFGVFPAYVEVKESDKLTRSGFRPLNLTVLGVTSK